jgi:MFS transporter, SP family, sugar:H+ symporter
MKRDIEPDLSNIRWLAAQGRFDEAQHSLARAHGIPQREESTNKLILLELEELKNNVEYERQFTASWIDCFKPSNKILYRTLLGTFTGSLRVQGKS